jgi:hypothetical protein
VVPVQLEFVEWTVSPTEYGSAVAMLPAMLEQDRKQAGLSVGQAAWRLGVVGS